MIAPAPARQGSPSRAASSHAPQRWSIHSWLPRRPRAWQALACRSIMRRPHRVDLALSSGDVAGAGPAAHNRTLHIEAGVGLPFTSDVLIATSGGSTRSPTVVRRTAGEADANGGSFHREVGVRLVRRARNERRVGGEAHFSIMSARCCIHEPPGTSGVGERPRRGFPPSLRSAEAAVGGRGPSQATHQASATLRTARAQCHT